MRILKEIESRVPLKWTAVVATYKPGRLTLLQALEDCLVEPCRGAGPSCVLGKQAAPFRGTLNEEQQAQRWWFSWSPQTGQAGVRGLLHFIASQLAFFFFPHFYLASRRPLTIIFFSLALLEKGLRLSWVEKCIEKRDPVAKSPCAKWGILI